MADKDVRTVEITRLSRGVYEATNSHGAKLTFGHDNTVMLSPVELLLTAIAGCSGIDVDFITGRRAEPSSFKLYASGEKLRDDAGRNHVDNISVTFDISFPSGKEGDAARAVLERTVHQSHDRLCSVSQTVERETRVNVHIADQESHA